MQKLQKLQKAMRDLLKDEENIDKDYVILSKLGSNTLGLNVKYLVSTSLVS